MSTIINIVTILCFFLLTIEAGYVILSFIFKSRTERIAFIRSFKRGKCVAVFLTALPLVFLGYLYQDINFLEAIFASISYVIGLVVLDFGLTDISALINANTYYRITMYYCCVLVTINAVLFALSLTCQRLWYLAQLIKTRFTKKDKLYIFGNNEDNLSIYRSENIRHSIIADNISNAEDRNFLYLNKIRYVTCNNYEKIINEIFGSLQKRNNKICVVINTRNDKNNMETCRKFTEKLGQANEKIRQRMFDLLNIYVFGDPKYEAIYDEIVNNSFGCIHYKNKYKMIAMDFIDNYPLSKFMDGSRIDYKTALIKPDVDINVCMIGFGKINQQIFLTSVANNQFITAKDNGIGLKQVHYHIFDKTHAENNKNLNHTYYRFKNECTGVNPKDYLPLPDYPANETYYHYDINDPSFYNEIKKILTANKKDANFLIISFESDLENVDMAQKLIEKGREWEIENLVVFVRARHIHNINSFSKDENVIFIGNEIDCVYNMNEISNDKIFRMARMRNEVYDLEYRVTNEKDFALSESAVLENRRNADKNWFTAKSQLERESNLYCCLSLRSKLNLIGLDYCSMEANDLPALTEEEYLNHYCAEDLPDTKTYGLDVDGKKVIKYTLDFNESTRKNLATLEHLRWNSFMISKGMIPSCKEQILNEKVLKDGKLKNSNGKNYLLRRHGNITTFDGLIEFRKLLANRDCANEADYDVIKYDFQLLDDAFWLLTRTGHKIIKMNDKTKL